MNSNKESFPNYPGLAGKTVLITGGRSGIGYEMSKAFSSQQAKVIVAQRKQLKTEDNNITSVQCDLGSKEDLSLLIKRLDSLDQNVDILINNAATNYNADLSNMDIDAWERLNRINVSAPLYLASSLSSGMISSGWGRIINISSISIYDNTPYNMLYAASKSALSSFTMSWAKQLAKHGITVNSITPGFCETEFTKEIQELSKQNGISSLIQYESIFKTYIPTRKPTSPKDIAAAALFLCSPFSNNITGESLNICGGQFMNT